ncbi:MAG: Tn3 family transposase [Proteobacteria bacterium]|nr:Tn3 family transposase [Pseudomonadota bacterium]
MDYIVDEQMRRTIHAATNNSEQFNGFLKWAFFGGDTIIAENLRDEQRNVVKYNQLVANLVILFNCEHMTRIFSDMIEKGEPITPELISTLSPFRTQHINRFGDYLVDLDRKLLRLDATRELKVQPVVVPFKKKDTPPKI